MGFSRQPKLKPEIEATLKQEMEPLWDAGMSARQIAEQLHFGDPDSNYKQLKTLHVWFYRSKFGFKKRRVGIRKGRSRYKIKHEEPMLFQTFQSTLNKIVPKLGPDSERKRAYLITHYWTPLRKSEIIERTKDDFELKGNILKINLFRKKKFYRPGDKKEPFYLSTKMPMVDELIEWLSKFNGNEHPFNFSLWTGWNYVKEVFEGYYPHFFRFDYITKAVENATDVKSIIVELLNDTGLDLATVTTYIMSNPKYRTSINERELESLRESGIVQPQKK